MGWIPKQVVAVSAAMAMLCVLGGPAQAVGDPPGQPTGLAISVDVPSQVATLSWLPGSGPTPASYLVEFQPEGMTGWLRGVGTFDLSDPAAPTFSAPLPPGYDPLVGALRVTAVGADGQLSAPSDHLAVEFPAVPPPSSTRFQIASAAEEQVVATHQALFDVGLDTFPDGNVGVLPTATPGVYDYYANQGDGYVGNQSLGTGFGHTRGPISGPNSDPFEEVVTTRGDIEGLRGVADYVGGGSVYRDPTTGVVVMLYHREVYDRNPDGSPAGSFYGSVGTAWSADGGLTFHDLGDSLTPGVAIDSPNRSGSTGLGDVALVADGGFLYAVFGDNTADGGGVTAVARITESDLREAVRTRSTPAFSKYHDGRWDEPGVGGQATHIGVGSNPSIIWSACRREFVAVSLLWGSEDRTQLGVSTSTDLVNWSTSEGLYDVLPEYRIYNTLFGDVVQPNGNRVATGKDMKVLTTSFDSSTDFWTDAEVRVLDLTDLDAAGGCVQSPAEKTLADDPLGFWRFSSRSPSGYANEVPGGAPLLPPATAAPTSMADGAVTPDDGSVRGNALTCCGTTISLADQRFDLHGPFTLEWWEKPAPGLSGYLFWYRSQNAAGTTGSHWEVQPLPSGGRVFRSNELSNFRTPALPTSVTTNGGWRHMAVSSDGVTARWTVDGTVVASQAVPAVAQQPTLNGKVYLQYGSAVALDELSVYDHDVSTAQLVAHAAGPVDYPGAVLADVPAGYWRLGEPQNARVAADSSGNAFDGAYPAYRIPTEVGGPTHLDDHAAWMDGYDDGAATTSASTWDLTGPHTIEFWYRTPVSGPATTATTRILSKAESCPTCGGWKLEAYDDGSLAMIRNNSAYRSSPGLVGSDWRHVTLTYDGSTFRWYRDGEFDRAVPLSSHGLGPSSAAPLVLGKPVYRSSLLGEFAIDELAIFDSVVPGGHPGR